MEKKALFLDMDGTTLNDQVEIPKENLEAMKAALKAGHEIVVTTGRPTANTRKLLEQWGLDKIGCRYVISFNGGMVLDAISGDIIYEKTIPVEWMKLVAHEAKQRGVYVHTYEGNHVLSGQDGDEYRSYVKRLRMEGRLVSDLEESIEKEACKLLAVDLKDHEKLEDFRKAMQDKFEGKLDLFFSNRQYLEIVPCGVSKGSALEAFCAKMGIPIANSLSAGDENNDISMIKSAGIGCAVANARPEVKAAADYVTERDNNQAAIAEIIKKFMMVDM